MDIIERLHNCPNCGGTLQDNGTCRFCGSRVYDFISVDMEDYKPTYLRIKHDGNIMIVPVRFNSVTTRWHPDDSCYYYDDTSYITNVNYCMINTYKAPIIPIGELGFTVVGDVIVEDTKIIGSE